MYRSFISKNWRLIFLIISIVLIRLPPFYFTPIPSSILMSHTFSRLLISILFAYYLYRKPAKQPPKILLTLVFIWFLTQSLSIIHAVNISAFIDVYKDIVFSIILFFTTYYTTTEKNVLLLTKGIIAATVVQLAFQIGIYFFPNLVLSGLQRLIHTSYLDFFDYQFSRGRFFGDTLDEITTPLMIFFLVRTPSWKNKILLLIVLGGVTFITLASNWRTKFVLFILSLLGSVITFQRFHKKILPILLAFVAIFIVISNFLSLQTYGVNVFDRIVYAEVDETTPIIARFNYWKEAAEMGKSSPFSGVGLGNYFDNLSSSSQNLSRSSQLNRYTHFVIIDDPHNIFFSILAASGFTGLISFILLIGYFAIHDLKHYFSAQTAEILKVWIVVFWLMFAYTLFNPWAYFGYLGFFWFTRGVIEKLSHHHE